MSGLDDLAPDRRAVLQLLVARGRGYDEIAELLSLPEIVVRRRAHDALLTLAGGAAELADERRALLSDYLVGELPASRRAEARSVLADDPAGRRFARAAAARLSALPGAQLPELPDEDAEVAEALDALDARRERQAEVERASSRGAWLLVAAVALVVVVVVIALATFAGGGDDPATGNDGDSVASSTPAPTYVAELEPPAGGSSATGDAALRPGASGAVALALKASGLPERTTLDGGGFTAYAFWLDGTGTEPQRIGFYDDSQDATSTTPGTIQIGIELNGEGVPAITAQDLERYDQLIVSLETLRNASDRPARPGRVLLRGDLRVYN